MPVESDVTLALAKLAQARYASDANSTTTQSGSQAVSDSLRVLTTCEEFREAINYAVSHAQRLISIYTPDLEPELYDHSTFLDLIKHFVLARSFSKVRVLLQHPSRVARDSNRFIAMGRRLSSYIDIRHISSNAKEHSSAYLVADDKSVVFRMRAESWDGMADLNNPAVAKLYLTEFDQYWTASSPEHGPHADRRG
jgi:hypothetical protein